MGRGRSLADRDDGLQVLLFGRAIRPKLGATLAAAVGVSACIALGFWQLGRAQEKLRLAAVRERNAAQPAIHIGENRIDADRVEDRRVEARGRFDERGLVFLDNRVRHGVAGYEVVMPLRIGSAGMHVLVNRGWVASSGDRRQLPQIHTPRGEVLVAGLAAVPGRNFYELSSDVVAGSVWQNLTLERYRSHMSYSIQPFMIQQSNDLHDGLERAWPTTQRKINIHRSYAFQWFALAILIGVLYLVFTLRHVSSND